MMGQLPPKQNTLFYDFNLELHIPPDHLLRQIDQFLDFGEIREHLRSFYSDIGRPSIDPELMIRILLVGYCYGIRSERRLCEEINFNLAYRWFCGIGLEEEVPNHSTFSKNRLGRYRECNLFRFVFDGVVRRCMEEGLVRGEGFAIDASFVKADVNRQRAVTNDAATGWEPSTVETRAVHEYIEALDKEPDLHRRQKIVSLTDPMAQWTAAKGPAIFAYSTNYIIDIQNSIILDVEASPSTNRLEVKTTQTMIDRIESTHGIKPGRLLGDTAYGSAENLGYLVNEKGIEPHVPVIDKTRRKDGTFSASDFLWDEEADEYRCPENKSLKRHRRNFKVPRDGITKENTIIYRASAMDCKECPLKQQCCPNDANRKIKRSIHENAREFTRAINKSVEYEETFHSRKKVEMVFAHMKRDHKMERLRLRGLESANDEFLLVATTQNLRKMARLCAQPPPGHSTPAPGT